MGGMVTPHAHAVFYRAAHDFTPWW